MTTIKNRTYVAPRTSIFKTETRHIVAASTLNPATDSPEVTISDDDVWHEGFGVRESYSIFDWSDD